MLILHWVVLPVIKAEVQAQGEIWRFTGSPDVKQVENVFKDSTWQPTLHHFTN